MKSNMNVEEIDKKIKDIKNAIKTNKAKALGLAVLLTVNTSLTGCNIRGINDSYLMGGTNNQPIYPSSSPSPSATPGNASRSGGYHGGYYGGSYFYSRGGSYNSGSWGKYNSAKSSIGSSSYGRGGSVGIGG